MKKRIVNFKDMEERENYLLILEESFEMTGLDDRSTLVSEIAGYIKKDDVVELKKEFIKKDIFDRNKKTYKSLGFYEFDVLNEEEEIKYREQVDSVEGKNYIYQKSKKGEFYEVESFIEENPEYLEDLIFFETLEYLEPNIVSYKK